VIIASNKIKEKDKPVKVYLGAIRQTIETHGICIIKAGYFAIQKAMDAISWQKRNMDKYMARYRDVGRIVTKNIGNGKNVNELLYVITILNGESDELDLIGIIDDEDRKR
jgi:hypothetical protein